MASAGIAYSDAVPQPGMAKSSRKSDEERYHAAWHAAHCRIDECEYCRTLCDDGLVIACDSCGKVHHTDWLGWNGSVDDAGHCTVYCPECVVEAGVEVGKPSDCVASTVWSVPPNPLSMPPSDIYT